MLSVMIVAAVSVHWGKGVLGSNGIEVPLLYAAIAVALAFTGPGRLSLDALLGIASTSAFVWIALIAGTLGGFANLALRRPVAA